MSSATEIAEAAADAMDAAVRAEMNREKAAAIAATNENR